MLKALTPLYPIARKINARIAAWGPLLIQATSVGQYGTAFQVSTTLDKGFVGPQPNGLITSMSPDLIAGVLTTPKGAMLIMAVDCRTSKQFDDLPVRRAQVQFAPAVSSIDVLEGGKSTRIDGNTVSLDLEAGGGQLLRLHGSNLEQMLEQVRITDTVEPN